MFYLNKVSLDYLTVTSFNPLFYQYLDRLLTGLARKSDRGKHRMQYSGTLHHSERGTAYLGTGEQKSQDHHLLQVSGLLADDVWTECARFIRGGTAKCTRIDLQMTVNYDRTSWSQVELAAGLRRDNSHMSVSYVESASGPAGSKLATVYFGSRSSDRFVRIYEKMGMGEDVFLRFEVEYKAHRAQSIALDLLSHGNIWGVFQTEVDRVGVPALKRMFDTGQPGRKARIIRPEPATIKWLREQVAPALDRVLNDHNVNSDAVRDLLLDILTDARQ